MFCLLPSGMIPCPISWVNTTAWVDVPVEDEGANKLKMYVFSQCDNLFCLDRNISHLDHLSEQLTIVAAKLQASFKG